MDVERLDPRRSEQLGQPGQPINPESASLSGRDPLVSRAEIAAGVTLVHRFSLPFLREHGLLPYEAGGRIRLAVARLESKDAIEAVCLSLGPQVDVHLAAAEDIEDLIEKASQATDAARPQEAQPVAELDDIDHLRDLASGAPVVRALDDIFDRAVSMRATDIHFEPRGRELAIRLRIDGVLRALPPPRGVDPRALVSRIKILSGLNISERRLPQDGHLRMVARNREFDVRVATMPTTSGESAILRLLDRSGSLVDFERLGLPERDGHVLSRALEQPHGMLIVTGPTGSGKTTTLAAALMRLNDGSRKLLTIEDPVEYELPGVSQSQVRPAIGLTFASALRAFLRQDPDVVMVGEIRDRETAQISVQAALTGHLVLTSLHTNTAASAVTRLADIGIERYLVAATLSAVVGQRLFRRLCPDCSRPFSVTQEYRDAQPRLIALDIPVGAALRAPVGCERCSHTGYRGRQALFEVLPITSRIRAELLAGAPEGVIEEAACEEGMTTLLHDGRARCLTGETSVDEIFRVAVMR
jgi:general secretion pathway protein E